MQYRKNLKTQDEISLLGFGCMRFARDASGEIDVEKTREQFVYAAEHGVNYFDTAYVYPGSEKVTGKLLFEEKLRDKVFLATKLPRWSVKTSDDLYRFFGEQKESLRTDHIDYYLLHNFTVFADWQKLKDLGVTDFIERKKKSGEIRRIGFSFHGGYDEFAKIIDDYDWDFTQLQINYLDEFNQAGARGAEYALSKNVSCIIMEPLRGGQLCDKLPGEALDKFNELNRLTGKDLTVTEWALKWVWSLPNGITALSGMNTLQQVKENMLSADRFTPLTKLERKKIKEIQTLLLGMNKVPCTQCNYCGGCPQGVDIPMCFGFYNDLTVLKDEGVRKTYARFLVNSGADASRCVKCGLCEPKCPQGIEIRKWIEEVEKAFG